MLKHLLVIVSTWIFSISAMADVYVTTWVGILGGGEVKRSNDQSEEIETSGFVALSLDTDLDKGRVGIFLSNQNSEIESLNQSSQISYALFQSAIDYPIDKNWRSHLGAGLGASLIDTDWSGQDVAFAATLYTGLEYKMTEHLSMTGQLRWLGTVVDNQTRGICQLPAGEAGTCVIQFKTDWMNQFGAMVGINWRF